MIEAEDLTRDLLNESRCVCVTDGVLTLAVWQNPDDVDETGECRMVAVPEIRVLPVAHLISRIRALGWSEGFTNPTDPNN